MRRAILHIGTTKTGTTSIQRVMGRHRDELPAQGACYPLSPGALEHVNLHGWMMQRRALARGISANIESNAKSRELEQFPAAFASEMRGLPATVDRVILSEERLSMLRSTEEIGALKDFLAPFFDAFQIVVYLRSQDSYLASRYSELLRTGTFDGPDNVVATPERLWHHDYQALIARWAQVFGADSITPRIYERGTGRVFDSVDDFLSVCGVTLPVGADDPARLRNTSMSFAGQQLLLRMAELVKQETGDTRVRGPLWHEISAAVSIGMPGQGWLPTRNEAVEFMKRFEAGNEAIRQRYFPERTRLFTESTGKFPVNPMEVEPSAVLDAACMALFQSALRAEVRVRARKEGGGGPGRRGRRGAPGKDEGGHGRHGRLET